MYVLFSPVEHKLIYILHGFCDYHFCKLNTLFYIALKPHLYNKDMEKEFVTSTINTLLTDVQMILLGLSEIL